MGRLHHLARKGAEFTTYALVLGSGICLGILITAAIYYAVLVYRP